MGHIRYFAVSALLFMGALFIMGTQNPTCATAPGLFADNTCDPNYYESLKARAWLEAQREITQNQNLIFKSDSVLEYTCFDRYLNHLAQATETRPFFSMSDRWVAAGAPAAGNIEASLTPVAAAARLHQQTNFNHNFLGGRSETASNLSSTVVAGAYSCEFMNSIWEDAKCMNFIDREAQDGFFTFEQYATAADKRELPTACGRVDYTTNINLATGLATPWERDAVTPMLDQILPTGGGCGGSNSKLKTGLQIDWSDEAPETYNEYVCLIPGCHYVPAGVDTGRCRPKSRS